MVVKSSGFRSFAHYYRNQHMKRKNFISLSVAFIFLVLSISGILMYLKQKSHPVEMAHTIFGLLFVGFAIFHISNNWGSIKTYSKDKVTRSWKKEIIAASIGGVIILSLALTDMLEPIAEFGRIFAPKRNGGQSLTFQQKKTLESESGQSVTLLLQRKTSEMFTPIKVELADSTGKIISVLYEDPKPSEEDLEEQRPLANAIVDTKINAKAPFRIIVTSEKVKQETVISSADTGVRSFVTEQSPLQRALIEFN
jgi:hypothetical protein